MLADIYIRVFKSSVGGALGVDDTHVIEVLAEWLAAATEAYGAHSVEVSEVHRCEARFRATCGEYVHAQAASGRCIDALAGCYGDGHLAVVKAVMQSARYYPYEEAVARLSYAFSSMVDLLGPEHPELMGAASEAYEVLRDAIDVVEKVSQYSTLHR